MVCDDDEVGRDGFERKSRENVCFGFLIKKHTILCRIEKNSLHFFLNIFLFILTESLLSVYQFNYNWIILAVNKRPLISDY